MFKNTACKIILVALLLMTMLLVFSACKVEYAVNFVKDGEIVESFRTAGNEQIELPPAPEVEGYTFDGWFFWDGVGMKWVAVDENYLKETSLTENISVYARFHETPGISFKTLTVDGTDVYGKVSYTQTTFDFSEEVKARGNAGFTVTKVTDVEPIASKPVDLVVGDNTFRVYEMIGTNVTTYTVTIRRKPMYTVTFDSDGGTEVVDQQVEEDALVSTPETSLTGYTLTAWSYDLSKPITEDTSMKASWTANEYTVTFDANNGVCDTASKKVTYDQDYTLPADPTRVGYTFNGWYSNGTKYEGGNWQTPQDVTLTADWTPNDGISYKVEHYQEKIEDGYALVETEDLTGTSDAEITPAVKTYTGFTSPEAKNVTIKPDGSLVVEYLYDRQVNTVTLNANGGECDTASLSLKYGQSYALSTPTRTGYTFNGWYLDDTKYEGGNWQTPQDVTLTADWTPNDGISYKVEHYQENIENGYTLVETEDLTGTSDVEITPVVKSYDGFTAPEAQTVTIKPDGTLVVEYKYTRNTYTVTFDANGGEEIESQELKYGAALPDAERTGYTFAGWLNRDVLVTAVPANDNVTLIAQWTANTDTAYTVKHYQENAENDEYTLVEADTQNLTGTSDAEVTPTVKTYDGFTAPEAQTVTIAPDGNLVVEYYYTRITYTVTFNANGGEEIESQELKYGAALPDAERTGYTFIGWFYEDTLVETMPIGDISLTAKWEANADTKYTVNHYQENLNDEEYTLFETETLTGTSDSKVTPKAKEYAGFQKAVEEEFTIAADGTLVVNYYYMRKTYTVTLKANGGTFGKTDSLEKTVEYGASYTLDTPTRVGYSFAGWYEQYGSGASTTKPKNVTLIAQWTADSDTAYTVKHYQQNLADDEYTLVEDDTQNLTGTSDAEVTPAVKSYDGFTAPETQTVTIKPDGTLVVEYYYTRNVYRLSYTDPAGIGESTELTLKYGQSFELPTLTRAGYNFLGWFENDAKYVSGTWTTLKDVDLIAEWEARNDTAYTVKHYQENAENDEYTLVEDDTQNLTGTSDAQITPAVKSYDGFTAPDAQTVTVAADGSLVVEYYYTRNRYTVTFVTNGKDAMDPITWKYGAAPTLLDAERSGYTFGGWFADEKLTEDVTELPDEDLTVYAWWQEETKASAFTYTVADNAITLTGFIGEDTAVVIPAYIGGNPVSAIADYAFSGKTAITSITIPEGVTSIGISAFGNCSGLTNLSIPSSVTSLGKNAFVDCDSLSYYEYENAYYLGNTDNHCVILIKATSTEITSVTIASATKFIYDSAFESCEKLSGNLEIPEGVTSIGERAFWFCSNLIVSFADGSQCTSIGSYAFFGCTSLSSIKIPSGVSKIEEYTFFLCSGLSSIEIPSSVTEIGAKAFSLCSNLKTVRFGGTIAQWNAVTKDSDWNASAGSYTVCCSDGNLLK